MASWKKVIVSGSEISQLSNDSNYIAQNDTGVSLTGSFSGSFVGDGSELTGLPAAAISAYNNAADNRIITSVDSSTVQGEANLTFNGSTLGVTGNITVTGTVDGVDVAQLETDFNTLEGKTLVSGSSQIDGASITNNTVNFGGVSVALNGSDTTPAFNLSDATAYPGDSNLVNLGTVTSGDISAILPSGTVSGSTFSSPNQGTVRATINGNNTDVDTGLQVGDSPTFSGLDITNNVVIGGDLTVNGTTTSINTTNLDIEDQFILLNSGSSAGFDSGIVFGGSNGIAQEGAAAIWDASYNSNDGRLAIVGNMASTATGNQTPSYHIAGVYEGNEANAATAKADHPGNIRIDGEDIYIYA